MKSDDGDSRTEINELEKDAFFAFEEDHIEAYVDRDQLGSASGILVDGFDDADIKPLPSDRRRRDADDANNDEDVNRCKKKCILRRKRWTGPVLDELDPSLANRDYGWSSFIAQHAASNGGCVSNCLDEIIKY